MEDLVDAYLTALRDADLEAMLGLFAEDAIVVSPLAGRVAPAPFYRDLFERTARSETTVRHRLAGDGCVAVHFDYDWTLEDGRAVTFECVDVFELDADGRIEELRIVYDASRIPTADDVATADP